MLRAPRTVDRRRPGALGQRWGLARLVAAVTVVVLVLVVARPAGAQAPPGSTVAPAPQAPAPDETPSIAGTLTAAGRPVPGVRIEVLDDGAGVGEARTGEDGSFRLVVPAAGRYQVHLDPATLPEGIEVAEGRENLDNVVVFAGRDKRIAFQLVESSAAATPTGPGTIGRLGDLGLSGIRYGLVIALCAVGLTLIYATTGLVNFAHGELVTFGAVAAWYLSSSGWGTLPVTVAAVVAFAGAGLLGGVQDIVLWQPLRQRRMGLIAMMVVSIGLALLLRNVFLVVFDSNPRSFAQYATQQALDLGPLRVLPKDLVTIAVCVAALAATAALLRWSRLGTAVRAVADEADLARASGIDVRGVFLAVWTLGAGLAGLGGVALALRQGAQWDMGQQVLLVVFAAVVVGGFGSATGAMLGGVTIGVVSELSTYWLSPELKDALALAALVVVLLVRPQGILGLRERVG